MSLCSGYNSSIEECVFLCQAASKCKLTANFAADRNTNVPMLGEYLTHPGLLNVFLKNFRGILNRHYIV